MTSAAMTRMITQPIISMFSGSMPSFTISQIRKAVSTSMMPARIQDAVLKALLDVVCAFLT